MVSAFETVHSYITPLHAPVHDYIPFAPLDIYGAIRLSQIIYWASTGVLDPEKPVDIVANTGKPRRIAKTIRRSRPDALQECMGLMLVLFGGETFLAICTRTPPSWLLSPKVGLLFGLTHLIQTHTPLRRLIPSKPTLGLELLLSIPDAIGRTLLLTRFSIIPLIHQSSGSLRIIPTPTTLILIPFILASPFAALAFTGANLFSAKPLLSTPMEFAPQGWLMVDAWLPIVLPAIFCSLAGPIPGWSIGLGWSEEEAIVACLIVSLVAFLGRTVYNFGYEPSQWRAIFELDDAKGKIKTA